jgi:predicted DNA-binding protein
LTNNTVEQLKKPSAGITISRKISTGQYENAEVEAWASTGTLDSDEVDELEERLEETAEAVHRKVAEKIREIQEKEGQLSDEHEDAIDDALRRLEGGDREGAANLLQNILDQKS